MGPSPERVAESPQMQVAYGKLPLHFEANQGQTDPQVRFLARGPGYTVFLTPTEAVVALIRMGNVEFGMRNGESPSENPQSAIRNPHSAVIRLQLVGANSAPQIAGMEEFPGKANYFRGSDPARWRTNVPTYGKVRYREVYPGIDLVFYGNQRQLEHDFIVAPGADPQAIRLTLDGADSVAIDPQGDLVLLAGDQELRLRKPYIYQEVNGCRHEIPGGYTLIPQSLSAAPGTAQAGALPNPHSAFRIPQSPLVGFHLAAYDPTLPLVIDPVLSYATYLGGSMDMAYGIAVDAGGSAYITGWTFSPNFPTTAGVVDTTFGWGTDVFVAKLNPTGTALVYSTFLGGGNDDNGFAIAVDPAGNAYVAGATQSADFPTTVGGYDPTFNGGQINAFVAKLNAGGSALVYSTFLGTTSVGSGIALGTDLSAYVTGYTYSPDFPTTPGAFDRTHHGNADVFVARLNSAGSDLLYSTLLGGTQNEMSFGIALDGSGNVFVTGYTYSANFPTTPGAFDTTYNGYADAFVTRLNASGSGLIYSTFLGGNSDDFGNAVAVDAAGNAYVAGHTSSTDFPTTPDAFNATQGGSLVVYVARLNAAGSGLAYSTFLGRGSATAIAVDGAGIAYVMGGTTDSRFPTTPAAPFPTLNGSTDAFVTKVDPTGAFLLFSTLLGGVRDDIAHALAVDAGGNVYVAGWTYSPDFPVTDGTFAPTLIGGVDAVVAKISTTVASQVSFQGGFSASGLFQMPVPGTDQTCTWTVSYEGKLKLKLDIGPEGTFTGGIAELPSIFRSSIVVEGEICIGGSNVYSASYPLTATGLDALFAGPDVLSPNTDVQFSGQLIRQGTISGTLTFVDVRNGASGSAQASVTLTDDYPGIVTVDKEGSGTGTVISSPPGIDCGATCKADFGSGTSVTLTATAAPGSTFDWMTVDWGPLTCSGATCTLTVRSNFSQHVLARFSRPTYPLTMTKAGNGQGLITSNPVGIDCSATCFAPFDAGTIVTLSATAAPGSTFAGWNGEGCSGVGTCVVSMTQARNVTASFTPGGGPAYLLTVTKAGDGSGIVTSNPAGINCGAACLATYAPNTSVTLTAMAAPGSTFAGWSGEGCSGAGNCTVSMTQDRNVTATFQPLIPLSAVTVATVPAGRQIIVDGQTYTAPQTFNWGVGSAHTLGVPSPQNGYPGTRYVFNSWSDAGAQNHTVVTPGSPATFTATFTDQFELTITMSPGIGGTVSPAPLGDQSGIACVAMLGVLCAGYYDNGTSVGLTPVPNAGYSFTGWAGDCTGTGACTVNMTQPRDVIAAFAPLVPPGLGLYDDFSGAVIDEAKWQNLEVVREIRSGKLVLGHRYSGPGYFGNVIGFANPASIQTMQADVRLNAYAVPPGGVPSIQMLGFYYNDGTPGPGHTGDVWAMVYIVGTPNGPEIHYAVARCTNEDCSAVTTVLPGTKIKSAALGEVHTLALGWDGSVFTFTVDGVPTVVDPRPFQPVVNPFPNFPGKVFQTVLGLPGAGGMGYVSGDYDNVRVNGNLYDDFSGARLDPNRWANLELVREVSGGRSLSKTAGVGAPGTLVPNRARFANQNAVRAIRADVAVTAAESTGSTVRWTMGGGFYNDGSSTGGQDASGDVNAYVRIFSSNGAPLTVEFYTARCGNASCGTTTVLFSDVLGTVNLGETHTSALAWDGSVFTYGIDGVTRIFDPKPLAPVIKPATAHRKGPQQTEVLIETAGGYGYVSVTLDNVYVNTEALSLPGLAPFLQQSVTGDVTAAGVGLRGTGTGTINLTGIPAGATVQKALLYWATLGTSGTFTAPTLNGTPVNGSLIGRSDDPFWGASQSFAYRADVTPLVPGNGSYTIAGLPHAGPSINDSEGASLVVIYSLAGAPARVITINDGAVTLAGSRAQFHSTPLSGFVAATPPAGAKLTILVGDGQSATPEYAGINATLLATNESGGSDGNYWDTRTYDVSGVIPAGATSADAVLSTSNDSLVWVAAILSVPIDTSAPSLTLSLNQSAFHAGQQLVLKAAVTPGTTPVVADVYVALQLPDGSLLFLRGDGSFSTDLQPIVANWLVGPYSGQIFTYTCTGWEPAGSYTWLAAFTQPGTLNFIGPIVSAPFSYSP